MRTRPGIKGFVKLRIRDASDVLTAATAHQPIHALRTTVLKLRGAVLGPDVCIFGGFEVRAPDRLIIGGRSTIGDRAVLDARGGLHIGSDVNLSSDVHIWTAQHDWRSGDFRMQKKAVRIDDHAWLGPRVTVLPGAHIGAGVRVAAQSVVRGELLAGGLYAGIPARRLAEVEADLTYELGGSRTKPWWR